MTDLDFYRKLTGYLAEERRWYDHLNKICGRPPVTGPLVDMHEEAARRLKIVQKEAKP